SDKLRLFGRDVHIIDADGNAGVCRIFESQAFDLIEKHNGLPFSRHLMNIFDELAQFLLCQFPVDSFEWNVLGQYLAEYDPSYCCFDNAAIHSYFNGSVLVNDTG